MLHRINTQYDSRIDEEINIIQDNLKQIKLGRKHKTNYIKDLKSHPEIYKPFLIIMVSSGFGVRLLKST